MEIAIATIHSGASAARGSSVLNIYILERVFDPRPVVTPNPTQPITNKEIMTHIYNCNLDLDPGELNFGLGSQGNIIFLI